MASDPQIFLRLRLLKKFLTHSTNLKNTLLQELVSQASDPMIRMRRFRMLRQLCQYESQIIKKIEILQTDNVSDFLLKSFEHEIEAVVRRDA
jgi:hypothetical protein